MKKKTLIILLMINILTFSACGTSTKQPSDTAAPDTDTASVGTEPVSDADTSANTDGLETSTTD